MPHFMISAAHKSSGKTTISIGLCAALKRQGLQVQPFKKGPDYIDPLWLAQAAGRSCYNLDFYTMPSAEIQRLFTQSMAGADIGLIEGNKGLYDGLDLQGSNSNAALARLLKAPVVLVLDTRGMTRGIAPLILGYQAFEPELHIAAVILNHVGGSRHESKLRSVIEYYTEVKVIGAVAKNDRIRIDERHLGLMPNNETEQAQAHIDRIADHIAASVDLSALIQLAQQHSPSLAIQPAAVPSSVPKTIKIAYARDAAFGFYYQDDLEKLERLGAELIPFDTLHDQRLPDADALFIGGGFPETNMQALQNNQAMRQAIKYFIEAGGIAYAECGGLMYLCQSIQWGNERAEMVGVLPAEVIMHQKPQGRGYMRLCETKHHPWSAQAAELSAHEFHYSSIQLQQALPFAYEVKRGYGIDGQHDGLIYKNLLASYAHLRSVGHHHWTERFINFIHQQKEKEHVSIN